MFRPFLYHAMRDINRTYIMYISRIFVILFIFFLIDPLPFLSNARDKTMRAQYNMNSTLKIDSICIPCLVFFVKLSYFHFYTM